MRQALVRIQPNEETDLGFDGAMDLLCTDELLDVELLSCDVSSGVLRVTNDERLPEAEFDALDAIAWWERLEDSPDEVVYLLEVQAPNLPELVRTHAEELLLTDTVETGPCGDCEGVTFDLAGPQEAISAVIEGYEAAGASVQLQTLRDYEGDQRPLDALTQRQREVLETAFEVGYYDVPRDSTTGAVAAEFDVDASTVSEHLQRAERNLLGTVLGRPA